MLRANKTVMHQLLYDSMKPKYGEKAKSLCYSFTIYIKAKYIYVDIVVLSIINQDLIPQIMNLTGHFLEEKLKR